MCCRLSDKELGEIGLFQGSEFREFLLFGLQFFVHDYSDSWATVVYVSGMPYVVSYTFFHIS